MRLLVIGGTAFIGRAIVDAARAAGWEVVLFNRGERAPDDPSLAVRGDVNELPAHFDALRALKPDAVVHCICSREAQATDVANLLAGTAIPLVVLGSQDCFEAFQRVVRDRDPGDMPVGDDGALSTIRYYKRGIVDSPNAEWYDKNLMTETLLAAYDHATVLRLPMVYGPHDIQFAYRHGATIHQLADRRHRYVIGAAAQAAVFTYCYVENVASAVIHALGCFDVVRGRVFNVGETKVRSQRAWIERYAQVADWSFAFAVVPDAALAGETTGRDNPAGSLMMDCRAFEVATGWTPPVTLDEGIRRTLAYGLAHRDELGDPPDYAVEDAVADAYAAWLETQARAKV